MHPMIPWVGGKRRLAKHILPLFDNAHTCYVEPFAGAAAMLFARPTPAKVEVLNDINRDLVTLYRVVQHHLEEFVRQYKWALILLLFLTAFSFSAHAQDASNPVPLDPVKVTAPRVITIGDGGMWTIGSGGGGGGPIGGPIFVFPGYSFTDPNHSCGNDVHVRANFAQLIANNLSAGVAFSVNLKDGHKDAWRTFTNHSGSVVVQQIGTNCLP